MFAAFNSKFENSNEFLFIDELNKKVVGKWEYVLTPKPDKFDTKLENYLRFFYSRRRFPIIMFKKISSNNYEYGSQKVMIKIEGDTIRVRYTEGYIIIDKFIELNSVIEENKRKNKAENQKNKSNTCLNSASKKKISSYSSAKKK